MTTKNPFAEFAKNYIEAKHKKQAQAEHKKRVEALCSEIVEHDWDHNDPVVQAILDLIEVQNKIAYCEINDASFSYNYNHGQYMNNLLAWDEATKKRRAAAKELTQVMRKKGADVMHGRIWDDDDDDPCIQDPDDIQEFSA